MSKWVKPAVFIISLLPALWWCYLIWLAYNGDQSRLGPDPPKFLSLETGEWSIRFLTLALAVTPLRYLLNMPLLWRLRRMIGLYAFFYTTLHLLAFVLLWLQLNWADIGKEIAERPFITVGFAAYIILLLLALTSFSLAQRKMGRYWKLLHRTVYAAAVLAVVHLIWIVRSDFGEALLYGVLVSVLLVYRYFHKNFSAVRQFGIR